MNDNIFWSVVIGNAVRCVGGVSVGVNCTVEDCDQKASCPPDSELKDWGCVCAGRCSPAPDCHYQSKKILKHAAAAVPGDCCDVYSCVFPTGVFCCPYLFELLTLKGLFV